MKKILAMMLVLCLALAAVPALAEDDLTGTWYLLYMGMTGGTFELKADGTCVAVSSANGEEVSTEGTWTLDGTTVTLSIGGASMALTYDGTNLLMSEEAVESFGGGSVPEGMSLSMLSSFLMFSREPGKITAEEYMAYSTDGTVPEGKTKEEMDAIQAEMMMLALSMMGSMDTGNTGGANTADPAAGSAEAPELTIAEENFITRESYFGSEFVYIAKVQNNTESVMTIDNGSISVKDAEGNEIVNRDWLGTTGSRYLEPGEISFISFRGDLPEGAEAAGFEKTIGVSANGTFYTDAAVEIGGSELRQKEGFSGTDYYAAVTVTNTGDTPLANLEVIIVTRDAEGKMIDIGESALGMNELGAGSTITLVDSIDSSAVKYCEANNTAPAAIEAYAWVNLRN